MNQGTPAINFGQVSKDQGLSENSWNRDNSFQEKLNVEEKRLEERQKTLNSFNFGAIQSIFNVIPLEFDFNMNMASIENNFNKESFSTKTEVKALAKQSSFSNGNNPTKNGASEIHLLRASNQQAAEQNAMLNKFFLNNNLVPNTEILMPFSKIAEGTKASSTTKIELEPLIENISKYAKVIKANGRTTIELSLKPEDLGNILLNISSKNGIVSVEIVASRETKDILDANLLALKDALTQANINVGNLDVSAKGSQEGRENSNGMESIAFLNPGSLLKAPDELKFEQGSLDTLFTLLNKLNIYSKV